MSTIIKTEKAPAPIGPYSQAIQAQGTLYVSGQIPIDPTTNKLITGDIKKETHLVMKNLLAIVEKAGLTVDHIVKCSIFVKDMNDFTTINEIYGSYFNNVYPARETVEVSWLPKDVNVEISCIAVQ